VKTHRRNPKGLTTVIAIALLLGTARAYRAESKVKPAARVLRLQTDTAAAGFVPARRISGSVPVGPPPNAVGWIEGAMELVISATGHVQRTVLLRATPRLSDLLAPAVADWRFLPATDDGRPIASGVLVAAVFRPPVLYNAPAPGDPPVEGATASRNIPFPIATPPSLYPPLGVADAVVLVEVFVGPDGRVRRAQTIGRTAGFDQAALDTTRQWSFRPAQWNGHAVAAYAYLVFGFHRPLA
jgi:TonB family protein